MMTFGCVKSLRTTNGRQQKEEERDVVYENMLLRMRHAVFPRELYNAVREGDTGKIELLLELLCPQFIGARQDRYATEILEHLCGVQIEYHGTLKTLIHRNWLINPSNQKGKFVTLDEFMEEIVVV
jgi:hypothetical protein